MPKVIKGVFCLIVAAGFGCARPGHYRPAGPCVLSSFWLDKNSHLIPSLEQERFLLSMDTDKDGIENSADNDLDGDGVLNLYDNDRDGDGILNRLDPAPDDPREQGYNPFGVLAFLTWDHEWNEHKYGAQPDLERAVSLISRMGCSFVRMDFYWGDIEPEPGSFDFEKYDRVVSLLAEHNIGILGIFDYSAPWAAKNWNSPPEDPAVFAEFCTRVVSRYKDRVKYWEIWNEPDSGFYWTPQDNMKTYTRLLQTVYTRIKETDPTSQVLLGGLTQGGYYALQDIYRAGGKDYFDIMNIHPFVDPLAEDRTGQIRCIYGNIKKLMARYGDSNKKIWFTEVGCPGLLPDSGNRGWWMGQGPDEELQAGFLADLYRETLELPDVEKVFWAFLRDNKDHFKSAVDYFGLVRWDFSPKPSFYAYKKAAAAWHKQYRRKLRE